MMTCLTSPAAAPGVHPAAGRNHQGEFDTEAAGAVEIFYRTKFAGLQLIDY
jgi:hypothetical protein